MALSIGIVGLPNVGKSTLFNALTKKSVPAENYPFCTIDPSVGIVPVPDERLEKLTTFSKSEKTVPAVIEFHDIAGLVKGASEGEGLGNQFLAHIREVDVIVEVVRIFKDDNIIHVSGKIDPMQDIEVINLELMMADFQTVTKRLGNLERLVKKGDKEAVKEKEILKRISDALDNGKLASFVELDDDDEAIVKGLHLLTMKPIIYAINKKAGVKNLDERDEKFQELLTFFKESGSLWFNVDAGVEHEISSLNGEDKAEFRKELGAESGDGTDDLIKKCYEILDLITFLTTGANETRAWAVKKDSVAPEAGRAIHEDFKDKFIKADVINWQTLLDIGSIANAREKGLIRTEGKDYIVQDGDVIEFKI